MRQTTEKQAEPKKIYQQHRDRQRTAILEAAKELFIQKGIQGTTLGDIATQARVTRATIYQYFANQTDIAWAILEESFEEAKEGIQQALELDGTGYERIVAFLSHFLASLTQKPEHFRFLAQFDVIYANTQEVDRLLEVTQRIFGGVSGPITEVVRKGIADGSLRSNLNPTLTAAAIVNMAVAMTVRLEAHRTSVTIEYGHTPEQIFEEACYLLLQGIRAP
jgi:AcrR family transcriptional regulator